MTNQKLESWKKEQIQRTAGCVSAQHYGQTDVYSLTFTPKNTAMSKSVGRYQNIKILLFLNTRGSISIPSGGRKQPLC